MELPIFPLPELVLFPDVVIPLHIFEPRYRRLISDLMEKPKEERLFVLATYTGKKKNPEYDDAPFFHLGTICQIIDHQELPDGRSNILVLGLTTALVEEINFLDITTPYRMGTVEIKFLDTETEEEDNLRLNMLSTLDVYMANLEVEIINLKKLKVSEMTNLLSYALPFSVDQKLRLLEKFTLKERITLLIELMKNKPKLVEFPDHLLINNDSQLSN